LNNELNNKLNNKLNNELNNKLNLANNILKEINNMEGDCHILATWFSMSTLSHYHCLYIPLYRQSQKNSKPYLSLGFTHGMNMFMAQPLTA
jgi:hypothetical protein